MQGKKTYQEKLFINFQLSEHVPEENMYRKLRDLLDLSFVYKSTSKYYGAEGQKSIDPIVFMKLMLVGYLENLNSDRRIINISKMRLDILYFLGYDLGEEFPWHSTLSRTRQLYGQEVFTELFKAVLQQCIDKGMVSGRRQAVDGVYVKANASLDSMVRKEILEDADSYAKELQQNEENTTEISKTIKLKTGGLEYPHLPSKKNPGNDTHCSSTDPDAKMSVKPGKVSALNYLGQVSVDTASCVITCIQAFPADLRDSECLPSLLPNIISNLDGLVVEEIVADKGYSSGEALNALEEHNLAGYIPNRTQFIYEREGFVYHQEGDYYTCPNNKPIYYRGTYKDGKYANKHYAGKKKVCDACPLRNSCPVRLESRGAFFKETIDKPYYDRMHIRMQTRKAKILMKKRQSTVEPVIGTLINYMGMKRVNTKGITLANKCMTMAAIAYNLKKLLKHVPKNLISNLQEMKNQVKMRQNSFINTFKYLEAIETL